MPRLNLRSEFFTQRDVEKWNDLPQSVLEAMSLQLFKKRLASTMMVAAATPTTSVVVVMTATPPTAAAGWRHCTLVLFPTDLPLRQILPWLLLPRSLRQGHLHKHTEDQNC
nr:unnamed protein product [Spirometra erinaceieuropaei]